MSTFHFQQYVIAGTVVADAELKSTSSGRELLKFRLVTSESWKDKNEEWQEKKLYLSCVLWGGGAKHFHSKLTKSREVTVLGKLEEQSWEKDGVKHSRIQLVAQTIRLPRAQAAQAAPAAPPTEEFDDNDIPF